MGNSEKELFDRIAKDEPPASSASDQLRKDLVQWFEGRRNVALIYMMLWVIASIVPICTGFYIVFGGGRDTRFLLIAVTLIILGLSVNVLVKLWYWIIDNKISVIKELKLLQLTALNSQHTEDSRPDSLDVTRLGTLLPWTTSAKKHAWLERIRPRTLRWISLIVLLACVAGLVQVSNSVMPLFRDKTGVEQRDEWMITQSGDIRASSRLTFRERPIAPRS